MIRTFKRGIHPPDGKVLAMGAAIRALPASLYAGGEFVLPLSQHIGAPASALAATGKRVLAGQKIAEAGGFVSAPVHSPVSGTVLGVEPRTTASGETSPCLILRADAETEWIDPAFDPANTETNGDAFADAWFASHDPASLSPDDVRRAVREAGVVGLGGAGFPTAVKLTPKDPAAIDTLIINGAECEPYLTSDYRLMLERGRVIIGGALLLLTLFPNAKCVIGVENNKPEAIRHLSACLSDWTSGGRSGDAARVSVCPLRAKYPQGGERMLIYAVTGRKINSSMLPADAGCVVVNAATAAACFYAVTQGRPLTHRVMTVTGDGVKQPCNLEVPIGVSYRSVLEAAGGFDGDPEKVITGGPMMGTSLFSLDIPVTKTSASILAMKRDPVALHDTTPCVHCGRCLRVCPENLTPQLLSAAAEHDEFDKFEQYGGMECIECGCCAYVCPAKRHLVQSMRYGRRQTSALIRARKAAEAEAAKAAAAKAAAEKAQAAPDTNGKGGASRE